MNITKGRNLLKLGESKRVSFSSDMKQLNFLDHRVYQRAEGVYYPSVTSILQYMPKGKFFEEWLKEVGQSADLLRNRAAAEGTETHTIIEKLIEGEEISWINEYGNAICSEQVWQMVLRFAEFWNEVKPTALATEQLLYSDEHKYAGTVDLVCKIGEEVWILDFKTSNHLQRSYDLQLASYARAWEEMGKGKIDKAGVLWLKSSKRGPSNQKGKFQGKGWEVSIVDDVEKNFELFKLIYKLYELDHPKIQPIYVEYPTSIKL